MASDEVFAQRLRLAATAVGSTRPQMAATLAQSDLPDGDLQMVGGFVNGMDTATALRLARVSGAKAELDATDRSQLDALNEPHEDVDAAAGDKDSRNWLERLVEGTAHAVSNTGSFLGDYVLHPLVSALDATANVAKMPARILSSAIDGENDDEIDAAMRAKGYDPGSAWDYVQFMTNQGNSLYHDLDGIRGTYGDEAVDLAIEAQQDPEGFQERLPSRDQRIQDLVNSDDFAKAADLVGRQHISPGRDVARVVMMGDTDNAAFTALSGVLDAAYLIATDPTLLLGRVARGVRALDAAGNAITQSGRVARATGYAQVERGLVKVADAATGGKFRAGLRDGLDTDGMRQLLRTEGGQPVTQAGRGVADFLSRAKALREAPDEATRASIYADMQIRHKALMPFLDEVNGGRVVRQLEDGQTGVDKLVDVNGVAWERATNGRTIDTVDQFATYMADTTGLLRLAGGFAAKRELYLPGRVSLRSRIGARNAGRRAKKGVLRDAEAWRFDHSKPYTIFPHEAEESIQARLDDVERETRDDLAQAALRGDAIYNELRTGTAQGGGWHPIKEARAKWERRARRVSSLMPTVQAIDLTSSAGTEQVRAFARLYMNKAEADRLASLYALGDLGQRRQIVHGIVEQTFHASGLSRSEQGLKEIERFRADQLEIDKRAYGLDRTDVIHTDAGARHVALFESQLNDNVLIPDFRSLQYLASKHVVGGFVTRKMGAFRAGFTGDRMDSVMGAIKLGWITSAAGGLRNGLDEVVGSALTGGGSDLVRGRALLSAATKQGRKETLQARKAARVAEGRMRYTIPMGMRRASNFVDDVFVAGTLGRLMSFRTAEKITEKEAQYAAELAGDLQAGLVRESITGTYFADQALVHGDAAAMQMHGAGVMGAKVQFRGENVKHEFDGWQQVENDGGQGLDAWSTMLGHAFQDANSPAHVALQSMIDGTDVVANVIAHLQTPAMRRFVDNAEILQTVRNGRRVRPGNLDDQLEAMERYAENMTAHVHKLVTGKNGMIDAGLIDQLRAGTIPDRSWLKANVPADFQPEHVIRPVFLPVNPKHAVGKLAEGYTSLLTRAYDQVVTKQVNAISRNPMLTAAYVQARKHIAGYEKHLTAAGYTPEVAEAAAKRMARIHAEQQVIKMIDNPQVASQFSILARNFWAFERAQEDWLRRWGRIIVDDPSVIQKVNLTLHGAESAGLVERNDEGDMVFTYPGSGMVINAFTKLSSKIGLGGMINIPMMPDLTSQVTFLNPSLDNPLGFSGTPVVSIPLKLMAATVGADYPLLMSSMDKVANGEMGAGRQWYETLLPGFANRIISGVLRDDPASQFASAYTSALMNLEAAGRLDELQAGDPSTIARFQSDLKAQIANQMVARSLFGFFAPAAPTTPTNDVVADFDAEIQEAMQRGDMDAVTRLTQRNGKSTGEADWAAHQAGISSLKDEWRLAVNEQGYEKALEWWTANHPGELIYAHSTRTDVGTEGAQAPATIRAATWMEDNRDFVSDEGYGGKGGVAAYFIPQGEAGTTDGEYSNVAYRAQLELGIREYKSLDQFFDELITQRGEAIYFDTKDDYDAAIKRATAAGDTITANQLEDAWKAEKDTILNANPLLAAKQAQYATRSATLDTQIQQLTRMVDDPTAARAIGDQMDGVRALLAAKQDYDAGITGVSGERGYIATTERNALKNEYKATVDAVTRRWPDLADLARGLFRVPD